VADPATFLSQLALQYGYLGLFLAALLGSVIPFVPLPFEIAIVLLSGSLDPLALGIVAGIGGALGKATSYFLGRSGYLVSKGATKKNLEFLGRSIGRYGDLGVFIFAVTPLPDDVYFVPLGMVRFPFARFMLFNALGKVILYTGLAYFGRAYFNLATYYLGGSELVTTAIIVVITLAVTILLAKTNWELAYRKYKAGGLLAVLTSVPELLRSSPEHDDEGPGQAPAS
jgi:membrane protein DedA with SNARE-associated domain